MNTTNIDILRSFYSVTNRSKLNREIYDFLLKRWDLENVNLDEEKLRVETKISKLSKSKREAVKEFIILRNILAENEQKQVKKNDNDVMSMNDQGNQSQMIIGNTL